jgi:hypothetical protein
MVVPTEVLQGDNIESKPLMGILYNMPATQKKIAREESSQRALFMP